MHSRTNTMFSIILLNTENVDLNSSKLNTTDSNLVLAQKTTSCVLQRAGLSHTHTLHVQCAHKLMGVKCARAHLNLFCFITVLALHHGQGSPAYPLCATVADPLLCLCSPCKNTVSYISCYHVPSNRLLALQLYKGCPAIGLSQQRCSWQEGPGIQDVWTGSRNNCCCKISAPGSVQVDSLAADSDAVSNSKMVLAGVQAGRPWPFPPCASSAPSMCPGVWGVKGTALAPVEDRPCSSQSPSLHVC